MLVFCAFVLFLLSVFYDSILDFLSFVFFLLFCFWKISYLVSSNMCPFVVAFLFFFLSVFNAYFVCCSFCEALWGALCSWVFFSFWLGLFLFVIFGGRVNITVFSLPVT